MDLSGLFIVATKEFFDHLRSRKFLLIFAIFLIIAIIGMIGGIGNYNDKLSTYNEKQVNASSSPIRGSMADAKPSILSIYANVATYLVYLGAILGIAMGFDLITREKESKSLKILLSHPVYRDEVINGKALGGILALAVSLAFVLLISFAVLLIYGIVPEGNELTLILAFGVVSFLLIFSYFAIALFMSTVSDESGSALIYTIIIFIVLSSLVPMVAQDTVVEGIIGSPPVLPAALANDRFSSSSHDGGGVAPQGQGRSLQASGQDAAAQSSTISTAWSMYNQKLREYWQKRNTIEGTLALFSPTMNYENMVKSITSTDNGAGAIGSNRGAFTVATTSAGETGTSAGEILGELTNNFLALFIFPAAFFGLAYLRFMRLDVR